MKLSVYPLKSQFEETFVTRLSIVNFSSPFHSHLTFTPKCSNLSKLHHDETTLVVEFILNYIVSNNTISLFHYANSVNSMGNPQRQPR